MFLSGLSNLATKAYTRCTKSILGAKHKVIIKLCNELCYNATDNSKGGTLEYLLYILKLCYRILRALKRKISQIFKRTFNPPKWHNMRTLKPISNVFGFDRGTPIDRIYTDDFLNKNAHFIRGRVCEIAENTYTKRFGTQVEKSEILHFNADNPNATIIGDLTQHANLPHNILDCFICTVTLNFIYDYKAAIKGIYLMLKENAINGGGGYENPSVALVSVAGLVQVSQYDYERWGDYWRFTDMGIKRDFEEVFGVGNVEVITYGNVLSAIAELQGIAAEELSEKELFTHDKAYPVLICIVAKKFAKKCED